MLATREINRSRLPPVEFDFAGFGRWRKPTAPLAIEIGCGVGLHPIVWAKGNSAKQILAVERTTKKFEKFAGRVKNHPELENLWPAHADAAILLPQMLAPGAVDEYFVLYPNPEPKAPNRRLGRSPLLTFIFSSLRRKGILHVATNIESYALELAAHAPATGFDVEVATISPDFSPRSHFEKKYLARGERCWNITLTKS